jgi:putative phosphoribosyl transferase
MKSGHQKSVRFLAEGIWVEGILYLPLSPRGLILFSLGTDKNRKDPDLLRLSAQLQADRFSVMITDLVSPEEDHLYSNSFNVSLISSRLQQATAWVREIDECRDLPKAYFGYGYGAAAALQSLVHTPEVLTAACFSGRIELVHDVLGRIVKPVLLVNNSTDEIGCSFNSSAINQMGGVALHKVIDRYQSSITGNGKDELGDILVAWYREQLLVADN